MKHLNNNVLGHLRNVVEEPDLAGTKYSIVRKLAAGGMGTVYLAEDSELRRNVALKVMNTSLESPEIARRTMQEALFIAQLEHPGIVPIHDVGTLPDGRIFYVMKYVEGKRLDEVVKSGVAQQDLLRLFQKICDALAFTHSRGVIHRDLKPENIMAGNFGEVLIMDWGTAKRISSDEPEVSMETSHRPGKPNQTMVGTVIGTPGYMAPEQQRGTTGVHDMRTDVYALGGILYYMLTGNPPEEQGSVTSPREKNKTVTKSLNAVCLKALAADPVERYASVTEMLADINGCISGTQVIAYKESIVEKGGRWLSKNQAIIWMIITYLVVRVLILIYLKR